ncbi:hypothetical protein [Companilactobacillus nantensis]|uniref:Uncharacterized protein n=1 Tax=Companilactobacillus nantensis DSM 16982 TaxID=1423774 RepID=A0A0R1WHZ6_9LACO|nr:hypothetical protein [Companilactobacillus nantensis]KRM17642.1 hypothetical protein FD31_GL002401 [Companilactobacillus nantensis DSM 16982]GEO63426.1 hypothetical protein LNA01_06090 [Companilactobacillus nantensis]
MIIVKWLTHSTNDASKFVKAIYVLYRLIALIMLGSQIWLGQGNEILIVLLTLILFEIPAIIENKFKIMIPDILEFVIISFIFSSTILGELSDFYGHLPFWDTGLHTLNGFLAAGVGYSSIYLLNEGMTSIRLTPIFIAITSFCFSMTIGIMWEFGEFTADQWLNTDMQKDRIVQKVNSVELADKPNTVEHVKKIDYTVIHTKDNKNIVVKGGYLDVGLIDTMKDLFVNLIGAIFFSIFGYFYSASHSRRYKFIRNFMVSKGK